jgi:hypothetical protein
VKETKGGNVKTLKVEQVYENVVEYMGCSNDKCKKSQKTGCECGKPYIKRQFNSYKALVDGNYYRLSGQGSDKVRIGDEITGIVTEEPWDNGEKNGVNYNFKFPNEEDLVKEENEKLKAEIAALKGEKVEPTEEEEDTNKVEKVENDEDELFEKIPF